MLFLSCSSLYMGKQEAYILEGSQQTGNNNFIGLKQRRMNKECIGGEYTQEMLDYFHNNKKEYNSEHFWCIIYPIELKSCVGLYILQYDYTLIMAEWKRIPILVFEDKIMMNVLGTDSLKIAETFNEFESRYQKRFSKNEWKRMKSFFFDGEIFHYN